jgi:methyltransferase (TIGR00027 family)
MNDNVSSIRNVSDTAVWVAMYRARESERPGALFRDPYARRLAGERGEQITREMHNQDKNEWAYVIRTLLVDAIIRERLAEGVDTVINLAAGLDSRPYRMELPPSLHWVEVDLPDILSYKEAILDYERPKCRLDRVALDLSDGEKRRALFKRLGAESKKTLIISEGLLIYLGADEARSLAVDLAHQPSFRWWTFDIASPGLLKLMQKEVGAALDRANAPLKFAPLEGPWFFEPTGWKVIDVRGSLKNAAKVLKLPLMLRFFALFPERQRAGNQPWAGTCLLENGKGSREEGRRHTRSMVFPQGESSSEG